MSLKYDCIVTSLLYLLEKHTVLLKIPNTHSKQYVVMETLGAGPSKHYQFHDTEWIRCLNPCVNGSNRVSSEEERQDRKKIACSSSSNNNNKNYNNINNNNNSYWQFCLFKVLKI